MRGVVGDAVHNAEPGAEQPEGIAAQCVRPF